MKREPDTLIQRQAQLTLLISTVTETINHIKALVPICQDQEDEAPEADDTPTDTPFPSPCMHGGIQEAGPDVYLEKAISALIAAKKELLYRKAEVEDQL